MSPRHTRRFASLVILDLTKLSFKITHHSYDQFISEGIARKGRGKLWEEPVQESIIKQVTAVDNRGLCGSV